PAAHCLHIFPATTTLSTLSLHDALPISRPSSQPAHARRTAGTSSDDSSRRDCGCRSARATRGSNVLRTSLSPTAPGRTSTSSCRSEEHTSELQSRENLVCRLLLEKKKSP